MQGFPPTCTKHEALEEEAVADLAGSARSSRAPSISRDPDRDKADLGVAHLDISFNPGIGDEGFEHLVDGIARFPPCVACRQPTCSGRRRRHDLTIRTAPLLLFREALPCGGARKWSHEKARSKS